MTVFEGASRRREPFYKEKSKSPGTRSLSELLLIAAPRILRTPWYVCRTEKKKNNKKRKQKQGENPNQKPYKPKNKNMKKFQGHFETLLDYKEKGANRVRRSQNIQIVSK